MKKTNVNTQVATANDAETTTVKVVKNVEPKTVKIYSLNGATFDLSAGKFLASIKMVKDADYVAQGLRYFNASDIVSEVESIISTCNDQLAEETNSVKREALKTKKALAEEKLPTLKELFKDVLTLPQEVTDGFQNDKVLSVMSVVTKHRSECISDQMIKPVMDELKKHEDNHAATNSELKAMRDAIQKVLDNFSVTEENDHYNTFKFRANTTLANTIIKYAYKGLTLNSKGKNGDGRYTAKFQKSSAVKDEIRRVMVAKLQESMENTEDKEEA